MRPHPLFYRHIIILPLRTLRQNGALWWRRTDNMAEMVSTDIFGILAIICFGTIWYFFRNFGNDNKIAEDLVAGLVATAIGYMLSSISVNNMLSYYQSYITSKELGLLFQGIWIMMLIFTFIRIFLFILTAAGAIGGRDDGMNLGGKKKGNGKYREKE